MATSRVADMSLGSEFVWLLAEPRTHLVLIGSGVLMLPTGTGGQIAWLLALSVVVGTVLRGRLVGPGTGGGDGPGGGNGGGGRTPVRGPTPNAPSGTRRRR